MKIDLSDTEQRKRFATYFRFDTEIAFSELVEYIESSQSSLEIMRDVTGDNEIGISISSNEDIFSRSLRLSFVVLLHVMVEDRLKRTCDLIQKMKSAPLQFKDLRGDTLEQCITFLTRLAGVQRDRLSNWQDITDLSKIRNCIVHASGRIEESRDKDHLRKLIVQNPSYFSTYKDEVFPDEELRVSLEYCVDAAKSATKFFQSLFDTVDIKRIQDLIASTGLKE